MESKEFKNFRKRTNKTQPQIAQLLGISLKAVQSYEEFKAGDLCWFINGTICDGTVYKDWQKKMKVCRSCEVLKTVKKL